MKKVAYTLLFIVGLACKSDGQQTITLVDKVFLKNEVIGKDVQLVDVRTQEEYESGHIDDAVNYNIIDSETFLNQIETLNKNEPVYLYCKMGGRSNRAASILKRKGIYQDF